MTSQPHHDVNSLDRVCEGVPCVLSYKIENENVSEHVFLHICYVHSVGSPHPPGYILRPWKPKRKQKNAITKNHSLTGYHH